MGKVVEFRPKKGAVSREVFITDQKSLSISRRVSASPMCFSDLLNTMPAGHPYMIQRIAGHACPEEGQVWVHIKDDTLWVITTISDGDSVFYNTMIVFNAYRGDAIRAMLDTDLHVRMMIWNDRCRTG